MPSSQSILIGALALSVAETAAIFQFSRSSYIAGASFRSICLYCLLANLLLVAIRKFFIYPFFLSPLRHLPGPKRANVFIGNFVDEVSIPPADGFKRWTNTIPNDGLIRYRTIFNTEKLLLTSHEALKSVLSDNSYDWVKPEELVNVLQKILGAGLILVEGDVHKFQRKHLLPSFRINHIKQLYPVFWRKACELLRTLSTEASETAPSSDKGFEVEIGAFTTRATLDIIGIAGFGRDFNSLKDPRDELVEKYNWLLEPTTEKGAWFVAQLFFWLAQAPLTYRRLTAVLLPQWLFSVIPWHLTRRVDSAQKELHDFAISLVRNRRSLFQKDPKAAESMDDILSLLVKSNDFSDEDLANQTLTMMAAGHETTSSALSWVVYLLSKNPDVQTALRDEIRSAIPSHESGDTLTASQIDSLPLLAAVCLESLRLFPTVPVTGRINIRETFIGSVKIPKGTLVVISPWAVNRSTTFWGDDAEKFVPSRWINADGTSNKTGGATSNYSQITFLHGPRSCIGQDFAQSELKCLVAAMVGRYSFQLARPDEGRQYTPAGMVTTKAKKGMWVHVKEVPGW